MPNFSAPHKKGSRERLREWASWAREHGLLERERLLPELAFDIPDTMPGFMQRATGSTLSTSPTILPQ